MTIDNVILGEDITPGWGNAVADQLNGIQWGYLAGNTDANGLITLTFPVAYSTAPVVTATIQLSTTARRYCHINTLSSTQAVFRCYSAGTIIVSAAVAVHWMAMPR